MVEQGGLRDLRPGGGVCTGTRVAASGNRGMKPEEHCPSECKHRSQNIEQESCASLEDLSRCTQKNERGGGQTRKLGGVSTHLPSSHEILSPSGSREAPQERKMDCCGKILLYAVNEYCSRWLIIELIWPTARQNKAR